MYELTIGPWNLDPWQTGEKFDVWAFTKDAEAGKYDGHEPSRLNRQAPWYQQLKTDVEDGVYDDARLAVEQAIFQKWREKFLADNPHLANEPMSVWHSMFVSNNRWIIRAMLMAGRIPANFWLSGHSVMEMFMRKPDSGWRRGRCVVLL